VLVVLPSLVRFLLLLFSIPAGLVAARAGFIFMVLTVVTILGAVMRIRVLMSSL
jgi:hypothetical protein